MPLSHIILAPEKCPLRREKQAPEDESGLDALLKKTPATQMLFKENSLHKFFVEENAGNTWGYCRLLFCLLNHGLSLSK